MVVFQKPAVKAVAAEPGVEVLQKILLNTSTVPELPVQSIAAELKVVLVPLVFRNTVLLKTRVGEVLAVVTFTSMPAAPTIDDPDVLVLAAPLMFAMRLFQTV